jgi:bifunctional DNase/RNase
LTQAETAALLGIETGAVKTRLHKARATLRRELWQVLALEPATETGERAMVEMRVADVRQRRADEGQSVRHFVVLEEVDGPRRLPIWMGEAEATALALHLESVSFPRPQTYAFAAEILRAAGGELREVRIDRLVDDVFYATAVVRGPEGEREIDARPSDALNLALLLGTPIRVDAGVIEACRVPTVDEWMRKDELTDGAAVIAAQVTERWAEASGPRDPADDGGQA